MSLYNGPPRGGNRGGKDQFSWENVKADQDREYYLGHSVKATVGRWQKHKDVFWYTKDKKKAGSSVQDELRAVKAKEDELMMQALGLKPKRQKFSTDSMPKLEKHEMAQLLRKRSEEVQEGQQEEDPDRIKGLGHAPGAIGGIEAREVLQGEGIDVAVAAPIDKQQLFAQQLLQRQAQLQNADGLEKSDGQLEKSRRKKDKKKSKQSHREKSKKRKRKRESDSDNSLDDQKKTKNKSKRVRNLQ